MHLPQLVFSRRLRTTPFELRVHAQGAKAFTIYNHMPLASVFQSPQEDYEHLCEHVQIWDVACERQVEVIGPDALNLVELITPRDISRCKIGQCIYAPLVEEHGGIVNDPLILRLDHDRFWISIADSDVSLWVKGIAWARNLDVSVFEPDVSPLAIQGPKAEDLMATVVGEEVRAIKFFRFIETEIAGTPVVMARSGWSGQGGFEIYLQESAKGLELWDTIWEQGRKFNIRAGCPNSIERIEAGLLSYGSDMTMSNNPLEVGLEKFCDITKPSEYIARSALERIAAEGIKQKLVNLFVEGKSVGSMRSTYEVIDKFDNKVGIVTSLVYSTRYQVMVSFATVSIEHSQPGNPLRVVTDQGIRDAIVRNSDWT